ncbi:uncharacterized protein PAC_04609 [Phialocephala subalpina]|uniref:2EXR domain-containing protein n=1 Tax=Phialocephala subalpina TaxID=576137 RepID=A0A1L7WPM9_9HELO|nr:uncharacterized protein PAC_04609 [Phialocephala subalpina]
MNGISHSLAKLRLDERSTAVTGGEKSQPSDTLAQLPEADGKDQMTVSIQPFGERQSDGDSESQEEFVTEVEEQPASQEPTEIEAQTESETRTEGDGQFNEGIQIDFAAPSVKTSAHDWEQHAQHPHIIELQSKIRTSNRRDSVNQDSFQDWVRVSAPSRQPPAILHVCEEARLEALKHYSLTNFETVSTPRRTILDWRYNAKLEEPEQAVYYNPKFDINIVIPRVAASVDVNKVPHLTAMRVLQGENPTIREGIKEITFVVPSYLWIEECNFDPEACFGPTEFTGVDREQQSVHSTLQRLIKRVRRKHGGHCGLLKDDINNWKGDRIPSFAFKSLQPTPEPGKAYESMYIPEEAPLNNDNWLTLREIEARTGCMIKTELADVDAYEELWGSPDYEIGFYGTPDVVEEARGLVKEALGRIARAQKEKEEARRHITFGSPLKSRANDTDWW